MLNKTRINKFINTYAKEHHISKSKYALFPVYVHLNGFAHSIGFTSHKPHTYTTEYTTTAYSSYNSQTPCWGYINEHQRNIAIALLSNIPHIAYQNNAKEIICY